MYYFNFLTFILLKEGEKMKFKPVITLENSTGFKSSCSLRVATCSLRQA